MTASNPISLDELDRKLIAAREMRAHHLAAHAAALRNAIGSLAARLGGHVALIVRTMWLRSMRLAWRAPAQNRHCAP